MKKIKFLILALLGITIIPTATNAYELSNVSYINREYSSSQARLYNKVCIKPGIRRGWILRNSDVINKRVLQNQSSCPDGYILGNFYSDEVDGPYDSSVLYIANGAYSYINATKEGEGLSFWRTSMSNNTHTLHKFSVPSRTAYQYTTVGGQKFMLSQVFFYHNQFLLYDPTTRFSVSFLGKMKIENGMLLVNPDTITDNIRFINFQKQKAWSMTTTKTGALKWLLGVDISKDRLESLQFDKSYTMEEGGSRFLPTQFSPNSQGETVGWLYNEDTEFISPDFKGNSNSQSNPAEAYNQCSSYWSDVKNLAYYSQKCGDDSADEQTQNRVKVDSWNAEGSLPEFSEGANKNKCGRFANAKKKYKEKYKGNREKFYADFSTYARTPESVNVEVLCRGVNNLGFFDGLKGVLGTIGNNVAMFDNQSQIEFERDFGRYITFKNACRDGDFMPTPLDKWYESLNQINPLNWIFGASNNNENVCKYAEKLESDLISKYGNLVFTPEYRKKVEFDLKGNIFSQSGSLSLNEVQEVVKNLPSNPLHDKFQNEEGLVKFLKKDYQLGVNKAYSIFSSVKCSNGIGIKQWDYLVYLPLVLLLIWFLRGKF